MRKTVKILITLIAILVLTLTIANTYMCFAIQEGIPDPNDYKPVEEPLPNTYVGIVQTIVSVIQISGVVISVVVITIIGIKYMIGSIEEKAEYKKTMIPYLIGVLFLFGTSQIVGVIYNIVRQ